MVKDEPLKEIPGECPTPRELGKAGWMILHSAAAVFPYNPTLAQQEAFRSFLHNWSHVYACTHCAYHMRRYLERNPPAVSGKLAINRYLCEFHNAVNGRVGNNVYDCDPMNVLRRWHPTFPDMEDQPTVEEQVMALEGKKASDNQRNISNAWREQSPLSSAKGSIGEQLASDPRWTPVTTKSHGGNVGEMAAGWKDSANREKEVSGVETTITGAEVPQKKWWQWGSSTSSSNTTPMVAPPHPVPLAAKPGEDVEASVTSILSKLKACMVYCPDNEKSAS